MTTLLIQFWLLGAGTASSAQWLSIAAASASNLTVAPASRGDLTVAPASASNLSVSSTLRNTGA
jgi:hypothetical protein